MGIEPLGPNAQAAFIAVKPQEPGLARALENSAGNDKHRLDLIPAMESLDRLQGLLLQTKA
jgi:hypothetical protein